MQGYVEARGIRLARINIRLWRVEGLEAELQSLKQCNVDVGVLQESKLNDGIHVRQGAGYIVLATEA